MVAKKEAVKVVPKRGAHKVAPKVQLSTAHKAKIVLFRGVEQSLAYKHLIVGLIRELGPIRAN